MSDYQKFTEEFSTFGKDLDTIDKITSEADIFANINTIFGVPMCALDMVKSAAIGLLPNTFLINVSDKFKEGKDSAYNSKNSEIQNVFLQNGLYTYDPETGKFSWGNKNENSKIDKDDIGFFEEMSGALADIQGNVDFYVDMIQGTVEQIENVMDCVSQYMAWNASKGLKKPYFDFGGGTEKALNNKIDELDNFIAQMEEGMIAINVELTKRALDPTAEPLLLSSSSIEVDPSPFRLVYGPPKSTTGQFVLSIDGIYYDSQSGGIPFLDVDESTFMASGEFPDEEDKWKLKYHPSLGGKGEVITIESTKEYVDTVFSLEVIDDSLSIQKFYDTDPLLNKIIGQKNIEVSTLKNHIDELLVTYSEDSALVVNGRQSLQSIAAKYSEKINKRKKQIELYVKFEPNVKGGDSIPVNDFTYITNEAIVPELAKQEKLIFRQGELDGVVLPVKPKFVKAIDSHKVSSFAHLSVGDIGSGEVINMSNYDSSTGTLMNLTDEITSDGLISVYNFLQSNIGSIKSSYDYKDYKSINSASEDNFSQIVGDSSALFVSGLSIPFIDGIYSSSYMLLPDTAEFQDLTYKKAGFTVDLWTHMDNLNNAASWGDKSYRRVLLSCDNVGGTANDYTTSTLILEKDSTNVRGLQMGFATHRQLGKGLPVSEVDADNGPDDQLVFYMAPTQSYGTSSVGFTNKTDNNDCIITENDLNGIVVDTSTVVGGVQFNDASGAFVHIAVSVNPLDNLVKVYLDSVLMTSGTMNEVFGVKDYSTAQLPSISVSGSYNPVTGPPLNPSLFTPWVVGSSFVDIQQGLNSGYKAHIGSLKFYSRSLDNSEILANFNAQKGYFKNISI